MKKEMTVQDGLITEEVFTVPTVTISHSRKISDNNYGSSDFFVSMQLDVPIDASDDQRADAITEGFALARRIVDMQHAGSTATLAAIAARLGGEIIAEKPKGRPYTKSEPASEANRPDTKDGLWRELVDNPNRYFLNPASKKPNPKGPDARRKGTNEGLWLSDCPNELRAAAQALINAAA